MGMEVYGRSPRSEVGKYFQASIWSWAPLHYVMVETCGDLLDDKTLRRMAYNDGAGPEDQETCDAMAERINAWLEHHVEGVTMQEAEVSCPPWAEIFGGIFGAPVDATYSVDDEHLKEWVAFLRECGGFEVH